MHDLYFYSGFHTNSEAGAVVLLKRNEAPEGGAEESGTKEERKIGMSENRTMENRIREISSDIKAYQQAIENAEGALEEAERELDEILEECYGDDPTLQTLPPDAE